MLGIGLFWFLQLKIQMYLSTTEHHGDYWMLLKLLKDAQEVQTSRNQTK